MSKYHDDRALASDPVNIRLSPAKLELLEPAESAVPKELIDEHLGFGDSRAAVVASTQPLLVAAYTDELDCVVLLHFPEKLLERYGLRRGSRLLTVNTYSWPREDGTVAEDLDPGPRSYDQYSDYSPLIAEFLSDDMAAIEARKAAIPEPEWERARQMGQAVLERHGPERARDGRPSKILSHRTVPEWPLVIPVVLGFLGGGVFDGWVAAVAGVAIGLVLAFFIYLALARR